jgi:O-antigen/teichoic acid export membrane protein
VKILLPKSPFIKHVFTLVAGNAIAFIIPVLLYPALSRIFTPEDYAVYGLYVAVFSFLEIASAGRYDFAVVIPEKDDDAKHLVVGGVLISICYSLLYS